MKSPFGTLAKAIARPTDKAPVPYVSRRSNVGMPTLLQTGAEQQMRAMGGVGTLFAIVDRLANATGLVDWGLWRTAPSGMDEDRTEVTSHAALDTWNRPNQFFTRQELVESVTQHYDLTGEGIMLVGYHERMRSVGPLELWPVRPDRMDPVPDAEEFLKGWVYRGPDGEQIPLQLDEVIQLRRPNPVDPYRGIGAVQTILADLEGVRLSAEWNRNFFLNSAEPGGVIEVAESLEDDDFDRMVSRWQDQHRGVANAHRVAIIEQGKWVERKYTNRDMQFTELRSASRDVIREAFGIPKFAIGDVEDINRATANASKAWFAEQLVVPRLERIKQALNNDFLPLFGATAKGLEFDYCDPVPADREADNAELKVKSESFKVLRDAGVDPDDAADVVGLPRMRVVIAPAPPAPEPPAIPAAAARLDIHHHNPAALPAGPVHDHRVIPLRAAETADDGTLLPDLAPVQASWEQALTSLLRRWASITGGWVRSLIAKIRTILEDDGDVTGLTDLTSALDTDDAIEALTAALTALAEVAADQVAAEAAAQDVTIDPGEVPAQTLAQIATVTAVLLAQELATSAGREALRVWAPGIRIGDVVDAVTRHLEDPTDARPRLHLGGALTSAQHEGRTATYERAETTSGGGGDGGGEGGAGEEGRALPSVAYYGQEVNDANTCRYCREIDGRWLGNSIADARRDYPAGGYVRCEGRERCRGMVVATWRGGADREGWLEKEPVSP